MRAKKPRLKEWEEPKFDWPPVLPRPTRHKGKTLLMDLEREEKLRIEKNRDLTIPNYRSGDVLKIQMYTSLTEKKIVEYSGVCIGKKAPNSINAACKINFSIEGCNTSYEARLFSPLMHSLEILRFGSNHNRKKLTYIPKLDRSAGRLQEPVVHGRNYKHRTATAKK